jgi:hypothetical protein
MFSFTQTPARALAAAILLGSIVLAGPFAIAANHSGDPAAAVQVGSTPETLARLLQFPQRRSRPRRERSRIPSRRVSRSYTAGFT